MKKINKLEVEIPWWYIFFIRFMPQFYEGIPEYKHGNNYVIRVDKLTHSFFTPVIRGKECGWYNDNHTAYLKVRWKAMWKDFRTMGSSEGIQWCIKKK